MDYALPAGAPLAARRWLRSLLLMPPEPHVAMSLHRACRELWRDHGSLPTFVAMSPANVVLKLKKREGNADFFNELKDLCSVVGAACDSPALADMCDNVLVAVASETGVRLAAHELAVKLAEVRELVEDVVEPAVKPPSSANIPPEFADIADVLTRMKLSNEEYKGKVKDATIPLAVDQVENAWRRIMVEAHACVSLAKQAAAFSSSSGKDPYLAYDVNNNAAWIKLPRGTKLSTDKTSVLGLVHPRDRNGKVETAVYSTSALEEAQDEYRRSCVAAHDAVREQLRELAASVSPSIPELVGAASFSLIACVLEAHVRESKRRSWELPNLVGFNSKKDGISKSSLNLKAAWPYWLGGPGGIDPRVVRNSFDMNGMFLVTGPNMAGKSTMLRSTCACALLGACGLAIPADGATQVPYIDAFMLRNFSSDSPLEGRSSFAVEMMEMKYVLQDVTSKSLVLVDELGKGTEARAGAALAGAMLEALDKAGCIGAFATHLHDLLHMDLELSENTTKMKMEVEDDGERGRRPTWRMVEGTSTESLALEVARECHLPPDTLKRAAALYQRGPSRTEGGEPSLPDAPEPDRVTPAAPTRNDPTSPFHSLEKLAPLLQRTCQHVMDRLSGPEREGPITAVKVHHVPKGSLPGTQITNRACVYIARRPRDNRFYVGSSGQLRERILTHRAPGSAASSQVHDPDAEFIYVVVSTSTARTVETAVIKECMAENVPLLSTHDANSRTASE